MIRSIVVIITDGYAFRLMMSQVRAGASFAVSSEQPCKIYKARGCRLGSFQEHTRNTIQISEDCSARGVLQTQQLLYATVYHLRGFIPALNNS